MEETEEKVGTVEPERVFTKQEVENIVANINAQAKMQCENFARRCQALEEQLMFRRLDYLFKVIENIGSFNMGFVQKCSEEIETALTIPSSTPENPSETVKD